MGSMIPPNNWAPSYPSRSGHGAAYPGQHYPLPRLPPPEGMISGTPSHHAPYEPRRDFQRPADPPASSHAHPYTTGSTYPPQAIRGYPHDAAAAHVEARRPALGGSGLPLPPMPRQEFSNPGWDQERRERDRYDRDKRPAHPIPSRLDLQQASRPLRNLSVGSSTTSPSTATYRTGSFTSPALSQDAANASSPESLNRWPVVRSNPLQIPNLLGEGRESVLSDVAFRLKIRQQPKAVRSCGLGERDRRVIDPPPIVELIIESTRLSDAEVRKYRCFDSYVMSCSILDETGEHDASFMPEEYHRHQRRLMGSLVGTPFVGKDEFGKEGCFFTFADLSCRTSGSYRLKFSVIMIDPRQAGKKKHFPILTEAKSEIFTAYNAKDFPGMARSSELAHSLKAQGCILQLKKGIDRTRSSRAAAGDDSDGGRDYDEDDEDEDDDDGGRGHAKKRRSVRG